MMVLGLWLAVFARQNPQPAGLSIASPGPGDALQGIVSITGSTDLPGFTQAEVSFSYSQDKAGGWFLIQESSQAVTDGIISSWDTTTLTDGVYDLWVVVTLADGSQQQAQVPGIRVRNYTPIETSTSLVATIVVTRQAQVLPTLTPSAEVTATAFKLVLSPLPDNPAVIGSSDILTSMAGGGLAVAGLFLVGGLYLGIKYLIRR